MGELVEGDDGLPCEEVGRWAITKHESLCRYIDISSGVRSKWLGPTKGGATYIDIFCGAGRARVRRTGEFIDGSCVAAWRESVRSRAPFSQVFIADADDQRRAYAAERLKRAGAPVIEVLGDATKAAQWLRLHLSSQSLHFAFLDPYNLGAFDFSVVEALSGRKYIDMLVHISKMDLQRNTGMNIRAQQSAFDRFAPGWREAVDLSQRHPVVRREVFEFWRKKVAALGIFPSTDMQLITGDQGQHLYWLTLAARHELAHKFWKIAANKSGQGDLF
jgi:three-Cys-motif partner protein